MKIDYNFDCNCCMVTEIYVPDNATNDEIEQAIFNDIVSRYANDFNWIKVGEE